MKRKKELENVVHPIISKFYQAPPGQPGGQNPGGSGPMPKHDEL